MDSRPSEDFIYIRLPEVMRQTGQKRSNIYRMMKDGTFPKSVKIGNTACWVDTEVREWKHRQLEAR